MAIIGNSIVAVRPIDTELSSTSENAIANKTVNAAIASVRNEIGTPLVANTAAEMTDTNKIYVYVGSETGYTNGNWYYYDGSHWVSGGVYNSQGFETDKTLMISDAPADAKAVGDKFDETDQNIQNTKDEIEEDLGELSNAIDELSADSANLLDLKLASKVSASAATNLDVVDDSIRVHTSSDVAYGRVILRMQLKPNTVYVLSAQKHTVSGAGWIGYCESTDEGATYPSGINVLFARTNADDRVYIKPFTTTTGYVQFAFYCTHSTAEAGDVTFKTVMLNEDEYNGYYVPYLHAYDAEAETISNSAFTVLSNYIKAEISADDITTVSGSTKRLRNFGYMPFAAGDWISFVPGTNAQQIMLEYYGTADKTYLYSTDWLDALDTYIIPQDSFAIIKFRKADDSTIGVADYDATVTYTSKRTVHDFDALDDDAGIIKIKPSDIIQGAYNRDGSVMSSASRIRIKDFIPISVGDEIHFKPGAKAKEILLGYVNEYTSIQETSWTAVETTFVSNMTGFLMLLFRTDSTNPSIDYRSYDADVVVKKQPQFYTGSEKYNGDMFRINYADAIPYPVRNSNTYSVTYQQIINKYDAIANRVTSLYSNVSDLVPKPLTVTKTALQMTDSGYQMYKYTFTPAYPQKTVFVIAGTHGNEYEGVYSLINMVKAIYTSEYIYPQLAEFRDNVKLIIIPVVNPYGFEHNTKLNGDGVNIYSFYNTNVDNPKEMLSIKSVFESETLNYFMDMHTDPYNYTSAKGCYGYALPDGSSFEPLYNVIIRFRDILYNEFNYVATYISSDKDIVVGRISSGSVGYAEGRGVPANLIEISTGYGWGGAEENGDPAVYPAFAPYGSANMMRICTDFYTNVLLTMYAHLMSEVADVKNAIDAKAPAIINTASGDIASFADGADGMQIRKIVGTIVTPEGGSGWNGANIEQSGKNYFNDEIINGSFNADGSFADALNRVRSRYGVEVSAGNYVINNNEDFDVVVWVFTTNNVAVADESFVTWRESPFTFNIVGDRLVKFAWRRKNNANLVPSDISGITLYDNRTTLPINWQTEAGTIYSGTVTLNEDGSADVVNSDSGNSYHLANVGSLSTYLGTNNVWIDTGSIIECDYPADTKLYIDGLTAPDEDMIANTNIASGKYFVVNNQLYLSTAAIAAGASIVPGTNCTATNLAEALNALNT